MTPFRTQNVPPPMSSYQIQLPCPPTHTCLSDFDDTLAVLLPTGQVQSWRLNTTLPSDPKHSDPEQRKVADPQLSWDVSLAPDSGIWQAKGLSLGREEIAVLFAKDDWKAPACELVIADVHSGKRKSTVVFSGDVERILWAEEVGWLALKGSGSLHRGELYSSHWNVELNEICSFRSNLCHLLLTAASIGTRDCGISTLPAFPEWSSVFVLPDGATQ